MRELMERWKAEEPRLKRAWKRHYGYMGLHWDEIKDAYQFGWIASQRPEFAHSTWEEVEDDLAEHWYNPLLATEETAWDYVREAVEAGWERAREGRRRVA